MRRARLKLGVRPVFKRIDSCAAEFDAATPYLYSTYEAPLFGEPEDEAEISDRRKIVILGGGPNRIGQGIEFDYCCCHAAFALKEAGYETIMVNCNPETVSTDPDTSDRLYFEPLTGEDVLEILHRESERGELVGVIVQLGGQTPLKLAAEIQAAGYPILGTSPDSIDLAEDRERFAKLVDKLGLQPARERPGAQPRRGDRGGRADRLSGAAAAELRARRAGDGGGRRARAARPLYRHRGAGVGQFAGADRPLSARRDRGRCRRDLRRDRRSRWRGSSSISRKPGSIRATAPARSRPTA